MNETMNSCQISAKTIFHDIALIRKQAPLIHNITNFVVMNQTANALLALGASPIMAHAIEEIEDLISIANALVINIGTLEKDWLISMNKAMQIAKQKNISIVFDPVGAGASRLRTESSLQLIKNVAPTVIRANASEILALGGIAQQTKGTDSTAKSIDAQSIAYDLANQFHTNIIISGATDICMNQDFAIAIHNGVSLMSRVTGMGCTATSLIAAFCAVNQNHLQASAHAMALMGIAGEIAFEKSKAPGSFAIHFIDALYEITEDTISKKLRCAYE